MIYASNMADAVKKISLAVVKLSGVQADIAMREIATSLRGANLNRVYNDGLNTKEQKMGKYSTKSTLVGSGSFRNKGTVSKVFGKENRKKSEWVTIKGKRLMVFPKGYKGIREADGDFADFVVLKRTGKMMRELQQQQVGGTWVIGFPKNYGGSLTYKEMIAKFESKYGGMIWGISTTEEKKVQDIINRVMKIHVN